MNRRTLSLAVAALLAVASCAPKPAASPPASGRIALKFVTDWRAEVEHGGFYQALATGEFARRGLDVTLIPGGPGVNVPQLLATGAADLGIGSNSFILADLAAEGVPAKAVMAAFQHDPQVLMAHPDPAVRSPADLKGRPILVSAASTTSLWPWLKATFGYSDSQRRTYTGDSAPFIADTRAVQQGYVFSEPFTIRKAAGFDPAVFLLSDYGYSGYAGLVLASDKTLAEHPEAVRAFVEAAAAGWRSYLHGDPAPGDALIRRDNPEMTQDVIDDGRRAILANHLVEDADTPIGTMTQARWDAFKALLVRLNLAKPGLDLSKVYRLDFLPTAPAQTAAPASAPLSAKP